MPWQPCQLIWRLVPELPGPFWHPLLLHVQRKRSPARWLHACKVPFKSDGASLLPSPPVDLWDGLKVPKVNLDRGFTTDGKRCPQASQPCWTRWDSWNQVSDIGRGNYHTYVFTTLIHQPQKYSVCIFTKTITLVETSRTFCMYCKIDSNFIMNLKLLLKLCLLRLEVMKV